MINADVDRSGRMIRITFVTNPAPSNRAASKISFGIASIAALQSTTQNIFNNWFQSFSIEKMAAGAVLVAFVLAIFVLLLQRQLIKKVYEK